LKRWKTQKMTYPETGREKISAFGHVDALRLKLNDLTYKLGAVAHNPDYELKLAVEYLMRTDFWQLKAGIVPLNGDLQHGLRLVEKAVELRLKTRFPIQYILGRAPFFGLDFYVDQSVLIPRPETELVVEQALSLIPEDREFRCADVGTGSGCIAVAIAVNRPLVRCVATDISEKALAIARKNAAKHGVDDRIDFLLADVLDGVKGKFDLIVSNPPYVKTDEMRNLQVEVKFEPEEALDGGEDGLKVIRKLLRDSGKKLKAESHLVFEISPMIAEAVAELLESESWHYTIKEDYSGQARVVVATHNREVSGFGKALGKIFGKG